MKYVKLTLPMLILCCLGLSCTASAGAISEQIKEMCPEQAALYATAVDNFAIRMRDNVDAYGCGVVSAYGVFATEKNMDRIEQWEDNEQMFESVSQVFSMADQYHFNIAANPIIFDALQSVYTSGSAPAIDELISQATSYERKRITRNPERLLYLMWAMRVGEGQSIRQILKIYQHLIQEISVKNFPASLMLDGQIEQVYPEYSLKKRLRLIKTVFHTYSSSFMAKMVSDSLALSNIIDLLPSQAGDLQGSQGLTNNDLFRMQQDYQHVIKGVIASFEEAGIPFGAAVDATGTLAPYILDALRNTDELSISSYLKAQIHSPVFQVYMSNQKNCDKNSFSQKVAMFFRFLAPYNEEKEPIHFLQHNLARIANWYNDDANMRAWVIGEGYKPNQFIQNMATLPYYSKKESSKVQHYTSQLLHELPGTFNDNAAFLNVLFQQTDYFTWLKGAADADVIVYANEDAGDPSNPKYRYILTTPFPSQDDSSVFDRFIQNGSGISAVSLLHGYSVDDLSSHTFSKNEQFLAMLDNADNALMVLSIVAIPLTGGASIAIIGVRLAAKHAAKKGLKYGLKVGYRYIRKTASRNIRRSASRLAGKEGKKAFLREGKELLEWAPKRGRPSLYSKTQSGLLKTVIRVDYLSFTVAASGIATGIYCARFANHDSNQVTQDICRIQPERTNKNICHTFKP